MATWQIKGKKITVDRPPVESGAGVTPMPNQVEGNQSVGKVIIKDAQIIVNDGTTNRILIGYGQGLF